jgi:hypothetical protein
VGEWEGILQTDGYAAYNDIGGPLLVHVGCWAHARRKFVDAVKVNPQDGAAIAMVTRMDALFLIDRDESRRALTVEERQGHRRQYAEEWLNEIHGACLGLSREALPKSALGQAAAYTLNMWEKLRRCFDYAEVELSKIWRKTPCVRLRWEERTGCMWAARKPGQKWRRFFRWWNPAVGSACR